MAKVVKEFKSLSPKKTIKKASDDKIEAALGKIESTAPRKQKSVQLNVKLPKNLYDLLHNEALRRGQSKKSILVDALWDKLG